MICPTAEVSNDMAAQACSYTRHRQASEIRNLRLSIGKWLCRMSASHDFGSFHLDVDWLSAFQWPLDSIPMICTSSGQFLGSVDFLLPVDFYRGAATAHEHAEAACQLVS